MLTGTQSSRIPEALLPTSRRPGRGIIVSITWFFILQPYLSPSPTNNDLQPVALILAGLLLLLEVATKNALARKFSLLMLFSVCLEVFHFVLFNSFAVIYIATYIFLSFAWKHSSEISSFLIRGVMAWHLFGIIWQTVDPTSFGFIFEHVLRDVKHSLDSGRGATGFTPEPGFAGALSTVYALMYFRFFGDKESAARKLLFFLMYIVSISLSSSTLGYLFFPLVLATMFFGGREKRYKLIKLCAMTLAIFGVAASFFDQTSVSQRGLKFAQQLVTEPALVIYDSSLQERLRSLYIGLNVMVVKPFGMGHGNFPAATEWAHQQLALDNLFSESRDIQGSASGAGTVMAGTGVLGALFYLVVFAGLLGRSSLADVGVWVVSVAMFLFSFSPAFPLIYTLLVLRYRHEYFYCR